MFLLAYCLFTAFSAFSSFSFSVTQAQNLLVFSNKIAQKQDKPYFEVQRYECALVVSSQDTSWLKFWPLGHVKKNANAELNGLAKIHYHCKTSLNYSSAEASKEEVRSSFITTTVWDQSPRSHHTGDTGRVRTGDHLNPALCHCQLRQDTMHVKNLQEHNCDSCWFKAHVLQDC